MKNCDLNLEDFIALIIENFYHLLIIYQSWMDALKEVLYLLSFIELENILIYSLCFPLFMLNVGIYV